MPSSVKRRHIEEAINGRTESLSLSRPKKRIRRHGQKQQEYHSSSEDEDSDEDDKQEEPSSEEEGSDEDEEEEGEDDSFDGIDGGVGVELENDDDDDDREDEEETDEELNTQPNKPQTKTKRNDPSAFASSISRILSTKLPSTKRADPVLARGRPNGTSTTGSKKGDQTGDEGVRNDAEDQRLERKVRATEKQKAKERLKEKEDRARVTIEDLRKAEGIAATVADEKKLRKTAQRGVVRLFNAVRAAQVRAAEAAKAAKTTSIRGDAGKESVAVAVAGLVGIDKREAKIKEMSRDAFLQKMMV